MPELPTGKIRAGRGLLWLFAIIGVGAALAIIGLFGFAALFSISRSGGEPAAHVAAKAASQQMTVQQVEAVWGTDLIAITMGVGDRSGGSPYGLSSGRADTDRRNLVLLDKTTGTNRRLLPDNDRYIVDVSFLAAAADTPGQQGDPGMTEVAPAIEVAGGVSAPVKGAPPPMAYYVVTVRQKDGPQHDLLVGNLATGSQAWLLTGMDGIDRMWMISPTRLGVLMRSGMKLQYRVIDIPALKLVGAKPVDIG